MLKNFLLHQTIRLEISWGVLRAIFDLRPHLVVAILSFELFVTCVTDIDATVKSLLLQNRTVGKAESV